MPIVHLYGTLHPQHHRLNSFKAFKISWGANDLGFPLIMEAKIVDSKFEISCDLPRFDESMISALYARGVNLVRAYSDAVSFALGVGFTITVDGIRKPNSTTVDKIQRVNSVLGRLCTAYRCPPSNLVEQAQFENILKIILGEPNLMGSLTDLADTLAFHHQTPTNCGRVLDSLRLAVAPSLPPRQGWAVLLQQSLRVSRAFQEFISDQSKPPRHGERTSAISEQVVNDILSRTWQIMDRFIEYRKRASQPLAEDEFPELVIMQSSS